MKCVKCNFENPEGFQFCGKCGEKLGEPLEVEKAIPAAEGERLGARPDLSRTYFEVGKRLLEPQSKHKQLNGIEAKGYLEKAGILFEEMDLERDLDDLDSSEGITGCKSDT